MIAQELSYLCHTVILLMLVQGRTVFLCIHTHTAELIDKEGLSMQSDSLLLIESRTSVLPFHSDITNEKQG